jgi:prepilin-type N-terminal cleavage/methylation domain-containing protein
MLSRTEHRAGLTLIELIVTISIIVAIAALTAILLPSDASRKASRGADDLQGWLLIARQQARRDGVPTGLRFYLDTDSGPKPLNGGAPFCRRLVYVQQPEDVAQGRYVGSTDESGPNLATAYFSLPTGMSFGSPALPVAKGDYLELLGGGVVRRIENVKADSLELVKGTAVLPGPPKPGTIPPYNGEPVNYRLIRQPVPIPGEQELTMPDDVGIDFNLDNAANQAKVDGKGPMSRNLLLFSGGYYEVLFAPTGALIGTGTTNAQVIFWVRELTRDNTSDILAGHGTLITVQPRTGFIAAHPAVSGADPYSFTKDARSSGM